MLFSMIRVPFLLEPNYDENKPFVETNRERLIKKWGGPAGWARQKANHDLKGRGMEAGIPHFNLDRLASNTMASHRLIQHIGKTYGLDVSEAVYDCLNEYYFVDGHSLNDRPRLAAAVAEKLRVLLNANRRSSDGGVDGGLDGVSPPTEGELLTFLDSNEGRAEIMMALQALNDLGIHGIPKAIIEGRYVVDGAAHADVFINVFREIEQRGTILGKPVFADMLGVSAETIEAGSHRREDMIAA